MNLKILFSFFCCVVLSEGYSQSSLIGSWRRMEPGFDIYSPTNKKLKSGDLDIRLDSTFHIEGDTAGESSVQGWHVGREYNGRWEVRNKDILTFWLDPGEGKMAVNFHIIELAKNRLVLRSLFNKDDKDHDIIYLRL